MANLLNQTRLQSGAVQPQPDWCDARDLIATARRGLGDALGGRAVRIEIPADMPFFMADAPLMEQVITNLLHNAAHHTPAGSPLLITAGVDERSARVFLTIADRGPGIPPEMREAAFPEIPPRATPPAPPASASASPSCAGCMLAQGGDVEAGNNDGPGARFTVFLPHVRHDSVPNE